MNVLTGFGGVVLVMTGRERELALCVGIGAALNLGLSAALISVIGLDGAAIGTATGLACANLLMAWFAWRRVAVWSAVAGPASSFDASPAAVAQRTHATNPRLPTGPRRSSKSATFSQLKFWEGACRSDRISRRFDVSHGSPLGRVSACAESPRYSIAPGSGRCARAGGDARSTRA